MQVGKEQSQPEVAAAALIFPYMVLGQAFIYRVSIVTHLISFPAKTYDPVHKAETDPTWLRTRIGEHPQTRLVARSPNV